MQKQIVAIGILVIVTTIGFTSISDNVVFSEVYQQSLNLNTYSQEPSQLDNIQMGEQTGKVTLLKAFVFYPEIWSGLFGGGGR